MEQHNEWIQSTFVKSTPIWYKQVSLNKRIFTHLRVEYNLAGTNKGKWTIEIFGINVQVIEGTLNDEHQVKDLAHTLLDKLIEKLKGK